MADLQDTAQTLTRALETLDHEQEELARALGESRVSWKANGRWGPSRRTHRKANKALLKASVVEAMHEARQPGTGMAGVGSALRAIPDALVARYVTPRVDGMAKVVESARSTPVAGATKALRLRMTSGLQEFRCKLADRYAESRVAGMVRALRQRISRTRADRNAEPSAAQESPDEKAERLGDEIARLLIPAVTDIDAATRLAATVERARAELPRENLTSWSPELQRELRELVKAATQSKTDTPWTKRRAQLVLRDIRYELGLPEQKLDGPD